jgi:hypothetical protein
MTDQFAMHKENLIKNSNINQKNHKHGNSANNNALDQNQNIPDKEINFSLNSDEIEAEIYAHIG